MAMNSEFRVFASRVSKSLMHSERAVPYNWETAGIRSIVLNIYLTERTMILSYKNVMDFGFNFEELANIHALRKLKVQVMGWNFNAELHYDRPRHFSVRDRLIEYLGRPESEEEVGMGELILDTIGHLPKGKIARVDGIRLKKGEGHKEGSGREVEI